MTVLVDSHTFLWCATDDPRLSPLARGVILDASNTVLFSVASAWELILKIQAGKLKLGEDAGKFIAEQLSLTGMEQLAITLDHAVQVLKLPHHHRDPFDRILVAQSLVENLPVLTADPVFSHYGVEVIW